MNPAEQFDVMTNTSQVEPCETMREEFSAYLDGAVSGLEMAVISAHLDSCAPCRTEFQGLRDVQNALAQLGPAPVPERMQAQIRSAVAQEAARGTHLPWHGRLHLLWERSFAPLAVPVSGAIAAALLLVGGLGWMFATPIAVQANDDGLADLRAPRYLYSQVPPQPIDTGVDTPLIIEAKVDAAGRVYDYSVLAGSTDDVQVRSLLEQNLLASVFRPASVFGVPVPGHVVLTFAGVSVRG